MSKIVIRDAEPQDFDAILTLNEIEEEWTSPMGLEKLELLHKASSYHKIAEHQNEVVGFLLAIGSDRQYSNENLDWFKNKYAKFIYIDRIIIDKNTKGLGIGRLLYQDLFHYAEHQSIPRLCCEYNLAPVNHASKIFHWKLGFKQVGERTYKNSDKLVSMQAAEL